MEASINNKVYVVTGAGAGIGQAIAVALLAEAGGKIAVTDIDKKMADSVAEEIKSAGGRALSYKLDYNQ